MSAEHQQLIARLDDLASNYESNDLMNHARGVRHATRIVVATLFPSPLGEMRADADFAAACLAEDELT